jgi:hypothetical protein
MFFDPREIFLLIVLVGVTGWVGRGLMMSWYKLRREEKSASTAGDLDERLRRIEAAVSGVITDVSAMREKERFMARLQAAAPAREAQSRQEGTNEADISPLITQSIPVIPRVRR